MITCNRKALSKLRKESRPCSARRRCNTRARRRDETSISSWHQPTRVASKISGDTSRLAPAGQGGIKSFGGHQQAGTSRPGWHQKFRRHQQAGISRPGWHQTFRGTPAGWHQPGVSPQRPWKSWKIAPCVDLAWFRVYSTGTNRLQGSFISGLSGGIPGTFRWNLPSLAQWASVP